MSVWLDQAIRPSAFTSSRIVRHAGVVSTGDVAEGAVGIALVPGLGADARDASCRGQLEVPSAAQSVGDDGRHPVRAVAVGTFLGVGVRALTVSAGQVTSPDRLSAEPVAGVPGLCQHCPAAEVAGGLPAAGVVGESKLTERVGEAGRLVVGVVGPRRDQAGGSRAAGTAAQGVVGVPSRTPVDGLAQNAPGDVVTVVQDAAATGHALEEAGIVVGQGGGTAGGIDGFQQLVGAVEPIGEAVVVAPLHHLAEHARRRQTAPRGDRQGERCLIQR